MSIPGTHSVKHGTNYGDIWDEMQSPIYRVLNEDGINVSNALVRHFLGRYWLYVDDTDGYDVLTDDAVDRLYLEEVA